MKKLRVRKPSYTCLIRSLKSANEEANEYLESLQELRTDNSALRLKAAEDNDHIKFMGRIASVLLTALERAYGLKQ